VLACDRYHALYFIVLAPVSTHPPGTARPQLSAAEASSCTPREWFALGGNPASPLATPWQPQPPDLSATPDFVVGPGQLPSVQAAVNAALRSGRQRRQYIHILPGRYAGVVYIPAEAPPLSLVGQGADAAAVELHLALAAGHRVEEYRQRVNAHGEFQPGDPAWSMYQQYASGKADDIIRTPGSAVVWSAAPGLQLARLSIRNEFLPAPGERDVQAVALRLDGDCSQLGDVRLHSLQDTLFANAPAGITRIHARRCHIEGDVDFVFGAASAVFEACNFRLLGQRRTDGVIFAPSTHAAHPYGFLVLDCWLGGDASVRSASLARLGRAWDAGASQGYVPGLSPNGQLLIRDCHLDESFNRAAPWGAAATSGRPFCPPPADAASADNPAGNRLWEYANHGPGAI
jgi:pectinesterase